MTRWASLCWSAVVAAALLGGCGPGEEEAPPGPGGPTGPTGSTGPSAAASAWLVPHNQVRAGTYPGVTVSPTPSPALPALTWSTAAEAVAQAWANGCVWGHNPNRSPDGMARGENIAAMGPVTRPDATPATVVGLWADEWRGYDWTTNTCTPPPPPAAQACGHYTQLVWRSNLRVGCAGATCATGSPFGDGEPWLYFVCDYEPTGYFGPRPY